ncbi:helix-turn-helix domain-containing protein [Amycolatopsis sp. NPDC049868]|uniref:helix-turn-helix domain-containing protein n=1 Tax=Amycolatopsis sp. NPDC049868 TaxID=3363934 RepID=UPI00378B3B24
MDPATVRELARKYREGRTIESLAAEYPFSYRLVRAELLQAGVKLRPPRRMLPPTPDGMVNDYFRGRSIRTLAEQHNMSYSQARRVLLAEGVVLRSTGRPSSGGQRYW